MTVLDSLTIEMALENRFQRQGHTIAYTSMHGEGSILCCTVCDNRVELVVDDGGWWTSNRDLDKECGGSE